MPASTRTSRDSVQLPRVSIVLPVFNDAAHLPLLLASLQAQTERSLEILAVDDGSTDGSLELLHDAARIDPRIAVFSQSHLGVSAARNTALDHARGRWLAFADSDDWLSPQTLQTWCDHAESATLDLVVGNGFSFCQCPNEHRAGPRALLGYQPWGEVIRGRDWIQRAVARQEWPHYVWLQLGRRSLLAESRSRFVEGMVNHSDILWTLSLALLARRVGFVSQPLYGYRVNANSLSRNPSTMAILRRAQSYLFAMDQLVAKAGQLAQDVALHDALVRHTAMESRNFLGLLRKRMHDPALRRELAVEFLRLGLIDAMFKSAVDVHDLWRALRSWFVLHRFAGRW